MKLATACKSNDCDTEMYQVKPEVKELPKTGMSSDIWVGFSVVYFTLLVIVICRLFRRK